MLLTHLFINNYIFQRKGSDRVLGKQLWNFHKLKKLEQKNCQQLSTVRNQLQIYLV